jgi:RNA recognition motif-containing protein
MSYDKGKWTRLFVGNLPNSFTETELRGIFASYPSLKRVDCKRGYGYVYFEDHKDGTDALRDMNGHNVEGEPIKVETVEGKPDPRDSGSSGPKYELRVRVHNLSSRTSWSDVKDWARNAGPVKYATVFNRGRDTVGIVEFISADAFDKSFTILENIPLLNERVRITKVPSRYYQ